MLFNISWTNVITMFVYKKLAKLEQIVNQQHTKPLKTKLAWRGPGGTNNNDHIFSFDALKMVETPVNGRC